MLRKKTMLLDMDSDFVEEMVCEKLMRDLLFNKPYHSEELRNAFNMIIKKYATAYEYEKFVDDFNRHHPYDITL